jgi:hypothetical protein
MPRPLKPLPRNIVQTTQEQIKPYLINQGKPSSKEGTVFTHNRAHDLSFKGNKIKDISVGLEDIDQAVQYYFDNVIKPNVIQNNAKVAVPVIFGDAEKWKSVQNDGFYRDPGGKVMAPIIMYRRTSVEKNRTLGNKLDGNKAHLFNIFETRYNQRNQYDKFSILTNKQPSKQYYITVVPDYVTVTYECVLFTNFIEQNNKLIEAIEFASDSYWGDFNRWHFRTKIDTFAVTNIVEQGDDRAAKTNFTMTLNGYLVPDTVNKEMANADMFYSPAQIIFGLETVENVNVVHQPSSQISVNQDTNSTSFLGGNGDISTFSAPPLMMFQSLESTSFIGDGINVTNNYESYTGLTPEDLAYISVNITKVANIVTTSTATFYSSSFLEPSSGSQLPPTSTDNFTFFANGVNIPSGSISGFGTDGNGNLILVVNTSALGYTLISTDEITATGKFA